MSPDEKTPKISVIMGCHNGENYLDEAIKSILTQSYSDFEFIIIDDASTDGSWKKIQDWKNVDPRIRPYRNETNRGLAASLNRALTYSTGQYIARMDADDISLPERFARQLEILEGKKVHICGTWIRSIGRLKSKITRYPVSHEEICAHLFFQTPFAHPTVMLSAKLYETFKYREEAGIAEDYDLWVRMSQHAIMENIPEVLLLYRVHKHQVSESSRLKQAEYAANIREKHLREVGARTSREEQILVRRFRYPLPPESREQVKAAEDLLIRMLEFRDNGDDYRRIIAKEWYLYCLRASVFGLWTWRTYFKSKLTAHYKPMLRAHADLFVVCLLRLRFRSRLYNFLEQFNLG